MPDPWIERIKTETYFHDANGTEWLVTGLRKFSDGEWHSSDQYLATYRIFQRVKYRGVSSPIPLEIRAYKLQSDEERSSAGLGAGLRWQQQLDASELRSIRIIGYPRLADGWLVRG